MKKIIRDLNSNLGVVKLNINDIEFIFDELKSLLKCPEYSEKKDPELYIVIDNFKIDSINDLKSYGPKIIKNMGIHLMIGLGVDLQLRFKSQVRHFEGQRRQAGVR